MTEVPTEPSLVQAERILRRAFARRRILYGTLAVAGLGLIAYGGCGLYRQFKANCAGDIHGSSVLGSE